MKDKVLIVIPALNEELTVGQVVKELKEAEYPNVVVIDDGSTDNTAVLSKTSGAEVISHHLNLGQGAAISTGFLYAKELNYEYVITVDADLQHRAHDVNRIFEELIKGDADIVIGSRIESMKEKYKTRYFVNKFSNVFTYLLSGISLSDSQSGLRGYTKEAINKLKIETSEPPGREICSEVIIKARRQNLKITEIPIDAIYTDYSLSKGQQISDIVDMAIKVFSRQAL